MKHLDIHREHDFFEYVRLDDGSLPGASADRVDVALLDMNHSWPNVGHDALVHTLLEIASELAPELARAGRKVRVISFDVRRRNQVPHPADRRFQLYLGTGGPGHLDPRLNDGTNPWSQGIDESHTWEKPLFDLFDGIVARSDAAMFAVCHSFGLVCRWAGIARPELRSEKSAGMPLNRLSREARKHPWFSTFARELPDHEHFRVVDNRLFDLILEDAGKCDPIAFEAEGSSALTMVELARDADGVMPRFLGMNHHPEIIDREHIMLVLDEKRKYYEVSDRWYEERAMTMKDLFHGENEKQSRVTSHYTLVEPLRHQLNRVIHS